MFAVIRYDYLHSFRQPENDGQHLEVVRALPQSGNVIPSVVGNGFRSRALLLWVLRHMPSFSKR